jgi:hypothetical protein
MKKIMALDLEVAKQECSHERGRYTGKMPGCGMYQCYMCGADLDPVIKKPYGHIQLETGRLK